LDRKSTLNRYGIPKNSFQPNTGPHEPEHDAPPSSKNDKPRPRPTVGEGNGGAIGAASALGKSKRAEPYIYIYIYIYKSAARSASLLARSLLTQSQTYIYKRGKKCIFTPKIAADAEPDDALD
jgi:hypothetical protein